MHRLHDSGATHVTRSSGCAPSTFRAESLTRSSLPADGARSMTQKTLSVCASSKSKRGAVSDAGVAIGASSPSIAPREATASGGGAMVALLRCPRPSVASQLKLHDAHPRGRIDEHDSSRTCIGVSHVGAPRSLCVVRQRWLSQALSSSLVKQPCQAAPTPPSCLGAPPGRCCKSPGAGGSRAAPSGRRPTQPRRSTPPPSSACSTA